MCHGLVGKLKLPPSAIPLAILWQSLTWPLQSLRLHPFCVCSCLSVPFISLTHRHTDCGGHERDGHRRAKAEGGNIKFPTRP